MGDTLFSYIERLHEGRPWGRFLDAGTGEHSLTWIGGLDTISWTAVTAVEARTRELLTSSSPYRRPGDRVVTGVWTDETLLFGETYETVLADYLLGALDGHTPYVQHELFARLRRHVADRLYVVGLEPFGEPRSEGGRLVTRLAAVRDSAILLAGDRCYREYPMTWVTEHLEAAGFHLIEAEQFPIRFGRSYIDGQIRTARQKLPRIAHRATRDAIAAWLGQLEEQCHGVLRRDERIEFGADYVVAAEIR